MNGIKILDFTRLLPGPMATHLLAQMGAEIIKIESPKRMDYVRLSGKQIDGASVLFYQLNHNKIQRQIDYNTEEGKTEIYKLVEEADIVIEQFRPGAMNAWGLGYEKLKEINNAIVYVSITGYGIGNAFSNEAGHDLNYLAYSGVLSLMKYENGKPTVPDTQFADISGAYMAIIALQSALINRLKTGKGSFVDVSLSNAMNPFLTIPYALYKSGFDYRKFNILNGKTTVNYAVYECADNKWISVAAMEVKFWNQLCAVIQKPEWSRKNEFELFNHAFPKEEVEAFFKTKTRDEWIAVFKGYDVCVAPILEIEELEDSNFHKTQQTFQKYKTPNGKIIDGINLPFKIDERDTKK